jgi:hypothetical protein
VLSATDLRLIMREMVDQAVAPLLLRVAELERRALAPSVPAFNHAAQAPAPHAPVAAAPAAPVAHAPQAAPVQPAAQAPAVAPAAPAQAYVSAMSAPAAPVAGQTALAPRSIIVAPPPLLDVAAIERDQSIDVDVRGFDGKRRRRRMVVLFVLALLVLFGGLFAMLADSYSHAHK